MGNRAFIFPILLEDTLLGFFLEPFHHSFRKRLSKTPKFYFFDPGVVRALTLQLNIPITPSTSYYGELFEHFIILQCQCMASYTHRDYRFSYIKTKDGAEIDLVVERPGLPILFIEIKSEVARVKRSVTRDLNLLLTSIFQSKNEPEIELKSS